MITGVTTLTRPWEWNPRNDSPWPSWNSQTTTPLVAISTSALRTAALIGSRMDRKNTISSTKISTVNAIATRRIARKARCKSPRTARRCHRRRRGTRSNRSREGCASGDPG